eukprot:scaffold1182_cov146-Skeletonema_dohrnii-CCMP3373.AAC.3
MLEYFIRDDDSDDVFLQCLWVVDGSIVCCLGSSFIKLRPYKTNIEYESRISSTTSSLSHHPLVPNQMLPHPSSLPQPYAKTITTDIELDPMTQSELPFISTIRDNKSSPLLTVPFEPGSKQSTPNVYDLLHAREALPNQEDYPRQCMDCLRIKSGANCKTCKDVCPTFCKNLCAVKLKEKPVKNVLSISGPRFKKDPERIIPRIIHQTWFEPVTAEKYPNMARLIESWKRSGWEYNFYDDAAAGEFLLLHFPPEVKDASDSITPGAFKAD